MRFKTLAIAFLLTGLIPAVANGQQNRPVPPANAEQTLNQLLRHWEKEGQNLRTLEATIQCTHRNATFHHRKRELIGKAKFMKPDLAKLELVNKNDPTDIQKFILTGPFLYIFQVETKEIVPLALPQNQAGQLPNQPALSFLSGMKVEIARRRFQMQLTHEDKDYWYIRAVPNFPQDQQEFSEAILSVWKQDYLPHEIKWREPTGSEVQWFIPEINRNVAMNRQEFTKPNPPPGWKMAPAQQLAPPQARRNPRVIRPQR